LAFQPFVVSPFAVNDAAAMLHPDAFRNDASQAAVLKREFGAAE